MRRIVIIAKSIKWGLRIVLFISLIQILRNYGMNLIYSVISSTVFMMFYMWCFWMDNKNNPIIRYDENGV